MTVFGKGFVTILWSQEDDVLHALPSYLALCIPSVELPLICILYDKVEVVGNVPFWVLCWSSKLLNPRRCPGNPRFIASWSGVQAASWHGDSPVGLSLPPVGSAGTLGTQLQNWSVRHPTDARTGLWSGKKIHTFGIRSVGSENKADGLIPWPVV